jgi:hypothetical protein
LRSAHEEEELANSSLLSLLEKVVEALSHGVQAAGQGGRGRVADLWDVNAMHFVIL